MPWNSRSRTDPERYELDEWDVNVKNGSPHMVTGTVTTNVGTAHAIRATFKVTEGTANLHELDNTNGLSLDVLTTAIAIAEMGVTQLAGVERVDTTADRTRRVKARNERGQL